MAAVSMFTVGATFSIFQGVQALNSHEEVTHSGLNYIVLGVAALLETAALALALRATWPELKRSGLWRAVRETKDPTRFIVVLEDTAALIGIALAAAGLLLAQIFGLAFFDGVAAILIGLLLGLVAIVLGYESRSLLLGESVTPAVMRQVVAAVNAHRHVQEVIGLQTMHLGPEQVLVGIEVHLRDRLNTDEL